MVDIDTIRELLTLMDEHELNEIKLREAETTIILRKGPTGMPTIMAPPGMPMPAEMTAPAAGPAAALPGTGSGGGGSGVEAEGLTTIKSPMVGTVYMGPDPESPPYVNAGSDVEENSPICIIEAMKVFNEIRAEVSGTIERVLVHNEEAVEYGQPLMLVRPRT